MDQFRNGYALLVGVGAHVYDHASLPATVRDVRALEKLLTDAARCAYPPQNIRVLHDASATTRAILDGLAWLRDCAAGDPHATAIVYYSGHGMRNEATEDYYLMPHDGVDAASGLAARDLRAALAAIQAERLLVILDCCHAEGLQAKGGDTEWTNAAPSDRVVADLRQGAGRAVFSSSRARQQSFVRPDGSLSLFTYHLLEALQGADNRPHDTVVTVANLMHYLGATVNKSAQQLCQREQTPFFVLEAEEFPIALIRAGAGLGKGGWQDAAEEARATIATIAPPVINAPIKAKDSTVATGNTVGRNLNQTTQSGGVNAAGATFGNGATIAGRNITQSTVNHAVDASVASTAALTIVCAPTLRAGQEHEVVVQINGMQPNKSYRVLIRAPAIQADATLHAGEAVAYITPPAAGALNLRAFLYEGNQQQPIAQTVLHVQVVNA